MHNVGTDVHGTILLRDRLSPNTHQVTTTLQTSAGYAAKTKPIRA